VITSRPKERKEDTKTEQKTEVFFRAKALHAMKKKSSGFHRGRMTKTKSPSFSASSVRVDQSLGQKARHFS